VARLSVRTGFWLPDSHLAMKVRGLGELGCIDLAEAHLGHGGWLRWVVAGGVWVRWMSPSNRAARSGGRY
jgi:hypothetical protein